MPPYGSHTQATCGREAYDARRLLLSAWFRKLPSYLLGLLVVVVLGGWVLITTFNSCVTIEKSPPKDASTTSELATDENIRALVQTIVNLHDRITALEAQQTVYPNDTHTHPNDHFHGPNDSIYDSGYHSHWGEYAEPDHTHWDYAELDHSHWGYADEFHTHSRY